MTFKATISKQRWRAMTQTLVVAAILFLTLTGCLWDSRTPELDARPL